MTHERIELVKFFFNLSLLGSASNLVKIIPNETIKTIGAATSNTVNNTLKILNIKPNPGLLQALISKIIFINHSYHFNFIKNNITNK